MTAATGILNGTPPVIKNNAGDSNKVDFKKISEHDDSDELDDGDIVTLTWELQDNEGDADATLASIVWTCDHPTKGSRVLATQVNSYTITSADYGCDISVALQPKTQTGIPRSGDAITVTDISAYDDNDNIIEGPVNPHSVNFTDYIVAPGTSESKTVSPDKILHTGWVGAEVQLETDNPESQIIWASSNKNVATVTQDGLVTFLTKGPVTIQARNDKAIARIKFNPSEFFIFSTVKMNWQDAKDWCESQGYTLPDSDHLSTAKNLRKIPADALWQEWGDISQQNAQYSGIVFWSSDEWGGDSAYYMYIDDGRITSNRQTASEGVACLVN
ncbi:MULTISPECIES: Ig-like domain-containing protein [Rahnella]|uniref:Ig-like domain-containing protein n=1 Tax=Rahnella laticis TaxID=2787622 RepID=A0ABS0E6J2_9GAMM|nr:MULTISPECIES: Ig-like domain-containing protein [Rahnella]MBF7980726.1 Ig-like domain-containing protein [Rahnella laticis]MBF8000817.1 Ig-like domain-containing protein [Rahnella sp. LAC-M12]